MPTILIYIFIPWFLPAYKAGGPIQSIANLVDQYYDASYRIFTSNNDLDNSPIDVVPNTWVRFNKRTEVYYASKQNRTVKNMYEQVRQSSPDIHFIIGVFDIYFNFLPLVLFKINKTILSTRGMLHPNCLAQKSFKKELYLNLLALLRVPSKCFFHVTNKEEEQDIRTALGIKSLRIFVASNYSGKIIKQAMPLKVADSLILASIALISPVKNHLVVLQALKKITHQVFYDIYGPVKNEAYWSECEEEISTMPANIKVTYHGEIPPAGVPVALRNSHVFILPSESENFGHAIVEALSAGRPVITSHNVPWTQLEELSAGMNVNPHDEQELIAAISFFASMEFGEMEVWGEGAWNYGRGVTDVEGMTQSYRHMFLSAAR